MRIAINGTGVAGPTLAYWLREYGHEPVLFEKAPQLRTGGYVIDFWGLGFDIAEKMELIPTLLERGYAMERLRMVGPSGQKVAGLEMGPISQQINGRFTSIARGDLASTLFGACDGIETHFGVSITALEQDAAGVSVSLSSGEQERFELVVGADGLHSHVRALTFGPESRFERPLGCYVAAFRIPDYPQRDELTYVSHTRPKRQVARISLRDGMTVILLICRSELMETQPAPDEQRAALRRVFGDMKWEVPEILDRMDETDELYFDRVSQIHLEHWTMGRVALLGDAAACASLLAGEGTGLAMTEAYVLAGELHRAGGDYARAFAAYEALLQPFVARKQRAALGFLGFFAPRSALTLKLRDWAIRAASIPLLTKRLVGRSLRDDLVLPEYGGP